MKKKLFFAVFLALFTSISVAKLAKVSKVYVTNETLTEWDRGPVYKYTGDKHGIWLTSRWGRKRSFPGYICKKTIVPIRSCIKKERTVRWRSAPKVVTSKTLRILPMNYGKRVKEVEIFQINRDQGTPKSLKDTFQVKMKIPNPDPKQFKVPAYQWLYPFEQVKTILTAKDGSGRIILDLTSERVGQHVDAYQESLMGEGAGYTGDKELEQASILSEFGSIGSQLMGPITAANPTFILGGVAFSVSKLAANIQSFTTIAKRSGLVVKPYVQGNYTVQIKHGKPKGSPGHWDDDNVYIVIKKLKK